MPRADQDTLRPPGEGGDAYSAETVVRAVPSDLLAHFAHLKPAKLPTFEDDADIRIEVMEERPAMSTRSPDEAADLALPEEEPLEVDRVRVGDMAVKPPRKSDSISLLWLLLVILAGLGAAYLWTRY